MIVPDKGPAVHVRAPNVGLMSVALNAWDAGLQVHAPKEDGSKMPKPELVVDEDGKPILNDNGERQYGWEHLQTKRQTREEVKAYFSRRRDGIGIITGTISGGVILFEFDCRQTYEQYLTLAEALGLGDVVTRIENGYCEDTPSGGVHWLVRVGSVGGNTKIARRLKTPEEMQHPNDKVQVLIETREEGGWAVLAPSHGKVHTSGLPYVLRSGSFATITTLTEDEHVQLWALGRTFDAMPETGSTLFNQSSEQRQRPAGGGAERPGDRFEQEAIWSEILPSGWVEVGQNGENILLRRPGKSNGHSATISRNGNGVLYVFTSSAWPFEPEQSYTKFGAYALLEHNGNLSDAARALAERYGMRNGSTVAPDHQPDSNGRQNGHTAPPGRNWEPHDLKGRLLTETGAAERLVDQYGRDIHFCHLWGQWLHWTGTHWKRDTTGQVRAWGKIVVRSIYAEAARIESKEVRDATVSFAKAMEKASSRAAMLKNAEVEPGVPIEPDQMDADGFLLNVQNGTVDLRTGHLRAHDRQDAITKLARVHYDAAATAPTFMTFLERVLPDPDVRAFVQRAVGYCLTADVSEQCLFFLHGGGANGKSTLLTVLQALMGEYSRQAAPELLVSRGGDRHPTELADLFGARAVMSVEVDEGKRLAETLVKQMTGGDKMKARFMRADFFEWTPTHKLFLAANHRPEIRGTDYAIWRRIHLIPFTVTIPKAERDGKLPAKLAAELPGILNWAIAGCLDWQRNGLGVPQAVEDATAEYRQEQDILADFIAERCVIDPQTWAAASDLYKAYGEWCETGGTKPITGTAFGTRLAERGHQSDRRPVGTKRVRVRVGLRLLGPNETPDPDRLDDPDRLGHENPHNSLIHARESAMPENSSNLSGEPNLSGDWEPAACEDCGLVGVSAPGLTCDDCVGVTR